jgi:hypothetical protein
LRGTPTHKQRSRSRAMRPTRGVSRCSHVSLLRGGRSDDQSLPLPEATPRSAGSASSAGQARVRRLLPLTWGCAFPALAQIAGALFRTEGLVESCPYPCPVEPQRRPSRDLDMQPLRRSRSGSATAPRERGARGLDVE